MVPSPLTPQEFDALCRANGLRLAPERRQRLWAVHTLVDAIRARLWAGGGAYEDESALVFVPAETQLPGPTER